MAHPSLSQIDHRPYPMVSQPWIMSMRWLRLCFLHWPVPTESLRPLIPEGLELDSFDGHAWLGVVPFEMRDVKPRFSPSISGLSHFVELNVRTYVTAKGKPGVWFFSLDASNAIAVRAARAGFHLPYFDAQMSCVEQDETVFYHNKRTHRNAESATFFGHYSAEGPIYFAKSGDLDYFLTERYCLYSVNKNGKLLRGEIHHKPWPLQKAVVDMQLNQMFEQLGMVTPSTKPLAHYVKDLDVIAWLPEQV